MILHVELGEDLCCNCAQLVRACLRARFGSIILLIINNNHSNNIQIIVIIIVKMVNTQ